MIGAGIAHNPKSKLSNIIDKTITVTQLPRKQHVAIAR